MDKHLILNRIKKAYNLSGNSDLARLLEVTPGTITNWYNRNSVDYDLIFTKCEMVNLEWLLTGEGEMLKTKLNDCMPADSNIKVNNNNAIALFQPKIENRNIDIQNIPLYEIEASAGLSMLFSNQSSQIPIGYITIPDAPKCDGAIPIRGDSMYPLLKSGDIACYKHLNSFENIQWGEIYIIYIEADGDEMFVTKYVQRSELGNDYISLVSYNKHHQPQDILKRHVRAMAMMKISIRYNTNI